MADNPDVICIGAGPAGLTAAYILTKNHKKTLVLEQDSQYVGGISRTIREDGFHFDIGGHRFFSKSDEIVSLWKEILGDDLLTRSRKSRIYYGGKFYPYPLNLLKTLSNLGIRESTLCGLSYLRARLLPTPKPQSFEEWVINHFGARLYRMFFKTYTEKVWGMKCTDIAADWAAQRIKGLSLYTALKNAMGLRSKTTIKTLIEQFLYPRLGPGMMWEAAAHKIAAQGGEIRKGSDVCQLRYIPATGLWHVAFHDAATGMDITASAPHIISSMPLRELLHAIPDAPPSVMQAADALRYRDFLTIALVIRERNRFDDNWIYIHDPNVYVGRIQNFKAWSPEMVPDPSLACYGMEYFCFEHDNLWSSSDDTLVALATRELSAIGLADPQDVLRGYVVRQRKAYPVYDRHYQEHVAVIRQWLGEACPGLQAVGRNGMHKYNNQDHSMMTALLAARNILTGQQRYDLWHVNQDAQYHESYSAPHGERLVPRTIARETPAPSR